MKMPELEPYLSKYSDKDIKDNFMNGLFYMTPEEFDNKREMLLFRTVVAKEKNISLAFVEKGMELFFQDLKEKDPKEYDYRKWTSISFAIQNHELTEEFVEEFKDHIDWETISRSKQVTLEFYNKYKEKIHLNKILVNLGHEFIEENFEKFGENLHQMELSAKLIKKALKEKKLSPKRLSEQKKFTKTILLDCLDRFSLEAMNDIYRQFEFEFEEIMKIANHYSAKEYDDSSDFNYLISKMLDKKELTLEQKKDIKYLAVI